MEKKRTIQIKNKEITILVAEDEEYNMMYINELFLKTAFNIIEAVDGEKAIEQFKKHLNIDLILMDIKMPVLNGIEAMKVIKKSSPNIPIVALSAFVMDTDKEKGLKEGFDAYLTKPIDRKKLFKLIDKFTK